MLKAGWYLDTTVTLDGLKQRVGVYRRRLQPAPRGRLRGRRSSPTAGRTSWYFPGGDSLLVDADGSGSFENDVFQSEACPFGPILYLGGKAYKVALAPDCKSLRVEPWTEALAEVALQPRGDQVRNVTLAWRAAGRTMAAHPARGDRRQSDGAARELPLIRVQPAWAKVRRATRSWSPACSASRKRP